MSDQHESAEVINDAFYQGANTKAGFVALIGAPNAGKSTLMNAMVGQKVSIVTPKVQTTRSRIRGIAMHGNVQLVFVDTPGIFTPKRRLDRAMVQASRCGSLFSDWVRHVLYLYHLRLTAAV